MHGGEGAGLGIAEQNRNAVGSLDGQKNLRQVADECVAILIVAKHAGLWLRVCLVSDNAQVGAVKLPAAGQCPFAFEEFEKPATILVNVFGGVFVKTGEV